MSTSNSCISNASQIDRGLHMHHIGEPSPVSMRHEFPFSQVHHRSAIIDDQQARNLHMNQNFQSFDGISSYASPRFATVILVNTIFTHTKKFETYLP